MQSYGTKLKSCRRGLLAALVASTGLLSPRAEAQYRLFNWGYNTWSTAGVPTSQLGTLPITWSSNNLYGRGLPGQIRALSNLTTIAVGDYHTLALKNDGTVWAWGSNNYGQLGNGTYTVGSDRPVQVAGLNGVIAIAAGGSHSIALKSDGTVWVWGYNGDGELGQSAHDYVPHPVPIQVTSFVTPIKAIAAGSSHNMARDSSGALWLWGSNSYGQIGNGNTTEQDAPSRITGFVGTSIAAGGGSSMAQKQDGTVWVWGGVNTKTPTVVPNLSGVTAMNTNGDGTFVIKSDGTLWNITTNGGLNAAQVPNISSVASVSSSNTNNYIAVALKDGTVWSVGYDTYGQLGDGTTNYANQWKWVQAVGVSNAVQVQAGYRHTVALKSDKTVWTWGDNTEGQLAAASPLEQDVPARNRLVLGSMTTAAIGSDSNGHAFYLMVKKNGDVWSWGSSSNGQLGDGGTTDSFTAPVQTYNFGNVAQVAASRNSSSYAIKKDGTLWAWGYNGKGQIGDNTILDRHLATQVVGLTGITAIAPGTNHAVALKGDGTVWAWGYNNDGELGDGTTTQRLTPVQVNNLTNVTAIAAGDSFSLALKNDGTVWAWGYNNYGLGNGSSSQQNSPIQITSLSNVVAIAAGYNHALALKNDGTVWAWGNNNAGALGNGTTNSTTTPQQVPGLANVKAIFASGNNSYYGGQSFAIKQDGTVLGWGYDSNGQLGDGITASSGSQLTPVQVLLPGITRILGNGTVTLALVKDADPDFNADNKTDLVWQNTQTGVHSVWYMNNKTYPGPYDLLGPAIPTAWTLTGTADMNGDLQSDLIWQNTQTGDVTVWYMSGATYTGAWNYLATGVPTQWKIVGIADLNGDSSADLLWQNTQTGDVVVWYMNSGVWTGNWSYIAQGVPLAWKIVGTADMDGDGSPDLIWQNASTGEVTVWYMKGSVYSGNWDYLAQGIPASWHLASIQDLGGSNQPNLIWRSDAGEVVCWNMDVVTGWTGAWNYISTGIPTNPWSLIRAH